MMMRMLDRGGIPALTDRIRTADASNPHGYYEYEPIKKTKTDPSWLSGAIGMAVKMVHVLLLDLPLTYSYRVVFMRRDIDEVIRSQNAMLEGFGKDRNDLPPERLKAIYQTQIDKVLRYLQDHSDHFRVLEVNYNAMVREPAPYVAELSRYLDGLDESEMMSVVDPGLYRMRSAS